MADKDTLNLIKFKFGSFQSIKDLSSKDQSSFYFASDKPAFYNAGLWYGVSSLTSSVNEGTGEVTLVINGGFGDNWKSSQVEHTFVAGMTKQQKADLEKAVSFVKTFEDPNIDNTKDVIDKWNEIISFLEGFKDTDVLLDRIVSLETNVTNLKNTTITGGDGLTGGGNLSGNRTIALGTPSTITDSTINEATGTTHTHAINEASTEQRGIVRLNNSLTSESIDQALTAKQGKVLKEHIDEMFELIDKGNGVKEIKAKYGLWSDSFISARGIDNESSGVGGLDAQAVWDLLMQNDDATKIINVAHIPDISIAKITDIANASVANAKTLDGVALNRFPYIYGYKDSPDLNTYVDGENKFYSLFIGAGHSSIPSGATYSTLLNVAGYNANTSFQLIGCQFQDKLYYRSGSSSPDNNHYIFNTDWKQIAFRETTLSGYGITDGAQWKADEYYNMQLNSMYDNSARIVVKNNWDECFALNYTCDTQTLDIYNYRAKKGLHIGTELDFGNNIVYHAGNLSPVTTNTDQTISGAKNFWSGYSRGRFILSPALPNVRFNLNSLSGGWGQGYEVYNGDECKAIFGAAGVAQSLKYAFISLNAESGYSNPSFQFYEGGKLTHKTLDVQESAHANMITNLNAEMVGGVKVENIARQKVGIDINNGDRNYIGYGYGSDGWYAGGGPAICAGVKDYYMMLFGCPNALYYKYEGTGYTDQTWKTVAFTDTNSLTPSGGTLNINGSLTATSIEGDLKPTLITGDVFQETKPNRFFISKSSATNLPNGERFLTGFSLLQNEDANYKSIFAISPQNNVYVKIAKFPWAKLVQENSHVTFKNITADYVSVNESIDIGTNAHIYGKLTVANQLTIGNATLYWDVANQCLRVNAGITSDSFLSAKGIDTTGNGQGGGGGFDAQMLWNELTISSPTNTGKVISSQFLPVQDILTPVASDISAINAEIIALQDRIANIEQALTWQGI